MGILGSLFGKNKSTATTTNQAHDFLKGAFGPTTGYTGEAGSAISRFLGGDTSGFDSYKSATGYGAGLDRILSGVTGSRAAEGLLRSGSTGDAYTRRAGEYDAASAGNYLQQLLGLGGLGLNAGQVIGSTAPQTQTSTSGGGGLGKLLGGALSIFSDPRLKTDVECVGELANGLPWYKFHYVWDAPAAPLREGLMSDDVRAFRPEAVIVDESGFDRVIYPMAMGGA